MSNSLPVRVNVGLQGGVGDGRAQWTVGMGPTARCGMNCRFCYSRRYRKAGVGDVLVESILGFFAGHSADVASVNLGYGEPTMHPEFWTILVGIRERLPKARVAITTNGHLDKVIRSGPGLHDTKLLLDEVDVSLDFGDDKAHDEHRGAPGAYRSALQTLALCASSAISVSIATVGTSETLAPANLERLAQICRDHGAWLRVNLLRRRFKAPPGRRSLEAIWCGLEWLYAHATLCVCSDPLIAGVAGSCLPSQRGGRSLRMLPSGAVTPSTFLLGGAWRVRAALVERLNSLDDLLELRPFSRYRRVTVPAECGDCVCSSTCAGGATDRRFLLDRGGTERDPYCPRRLSLSPQLYSKPLPEHPAPSVHSAYLPTVLFAFT